MPKKKRGKLKLAGLAWADRRARQRALTESVSYRIKYRNPKTGAFEKFKSGKRQKAELWVTARRLNEDRTKSYVVNARAKEAGTGRPIVIGADKGTKRKRAPSVKVLRAAAARAIKRKISKKRFDTTPAEIKILYPARRRVK